MHLDFTNTGEENTAVPNKTIYVSDADLPIFDRAQELAGGNLSAVIAQALRRYVDEAAAGDGEVIVTLDEAGITTKKRFRGRLITQQKAAGKDPHRQHRAAVTRVYRTEKGRFVVLEWSKVNWSDPQWWNKVDWSDPANWGGEWWRGEQRFDVYDTLEALRGHISDELFAHVSRLLNQQSDIEDLDI